MPIVGRNRYFQPVIAAWLVLWLVITPWIPSSSVALFGAPGAQKSAAGKSAAKMPHERVEDIARTLEMDQAHHRKGASRNYTMSENEINSYIDYKMKEQPVKGMKSLVVNLHEANQLTATALIDFSQIKLGASGGMMAAAAKRIMSGDHYLKMNGTLTSGQRKGQFLVNRAELGGVPIPNSLVQAIIKRVGEKQHPPVDLTQPFELPLGIEHVEISTGTVRVKT